MSTTDTLGGAAAGGNASRAIAPLTGGVTSGASDRARLTRDDFYKIMISELSNQDPFEPLDNRQFLEQLASLQTLDTSGRLSDGMDRLVLQNRMASASGLIGRQVRAVKLALGPDGGAVLDDVRGKVDRVQVQGSDVRLLLEDGRAVKFEEVMEIS